MNIHAIYAWCILAGFVPALAIVVSLVHYVLWRPRLRQRKSAGNRRSRLHPYCLALAMGFLQLVREFYQPNLVHLVESMQDEDADEDDSGDPETPEGRLKHFHRQLKRIRRGDPIDRLVLRI
jgi:hypothetical protein